MNQIPRVALILLLLQMLATLVIHVSHLHFPFWLLAALAICWRWLMHRGQLPYPGWPTKTIAVGLGAVAVFFSYSGQFSLESAVAFFVTAALLKLLEMKTRRDAFILVYLQFFLLATGFLFEQGPLWGLYGIAGLWFGTVALISLQLNVAGSTSVRVAMRYASALMVLALPVMLVLYLLFPRMGPLWSIQLQSDRSFTGLSESMTPGDIADLSIRDEVAFRASFEGDVVPDREKLYWRALVLDQYDGRTWSYSRSSRSVQWYPDPALGNGAVLVANRYEVIMEPTGERWMYALDNPAAAERDSGITSTGLLINRQGVYQRMHYRGVSLFKPRQLVLTDDERQLNLRLPPDMNPQARAMAADLRQQFSEAAGFSLALMNHFNQQPFHYTLKPPRYGQDEIDQFLFESRRGFCAHYAAAFVFLARSAGFPARMVTGYQGGEWNEKDHFLTVKQYDAHAWAEIWQEGRGWVRVDPTAAVAPMRVQYGLEDALRDEEASLIEGQTGIGRRMKQIGWLYDLQMKGESMNYLWNRWVLSYDRSLQESLLEQVFDRGDYQTMLAWMGGLVVGLFLFMGSLLLIRRQRSNTLPWIREWQQLQQQARQCGVEVGIGQTPSGWLQSLALAMPALDEDCRRLGRLIDQLVYQSNEVSRDDQLCLQRHIRQLRRRLKSVRRPATETAAARHIHEGAV